MTYMNITTSMEGLVGAIRESNLTEYIKSFIVVILNAYMEAERDQFINADRHARSEDRRDYRNGYYERDLVLQIGKLRLRVPRTRSGEFDTEIFSKYNRVEQSVTLAVMEAYFSGVSTRNVSRIVEELCGIGVSKSFVSSVIARIDPEIEAFQNRSLTSQTYDYVYVDALYFKQVEDGRSVSRAAYIAQAVGQDKKREIVGFMIGGEESTENWRTFFKQLRSRGLNQPKLIISDAHAGLKAAISEVFIGCAWQRCTVHFLRNLVDDMPKKDTQKERELLSRIFQSESLMEAKERREDFVEAVQDDARFQKVLAKLDEGFQDAIQYLNEPALYAVSLRTTNSIEQVNREIRRRLKVIPLFPNQKSVERLIGSVLMNLNEKWAKRKQTFLKTTPQ